MVAGSGEKEPTAAQEGVGDGRRDRGTVSQCGADTAATAAQRIGNSQVFHGNLVAFMVI